jgi:hypothetical protein
MRILDTVGQLVVTADLRASKVTCHVDVDAPREGRPTTRVNWLVHPSTGSRRRTAAERGSMRAYISRYASDWRRMISRMDVPRGTP